MDTVDICKLDIDQDIYYLAPMGPKSNFGGQVDSGPWASMTTQALCPRVLKISGYPLFQGAIT